MLLRVAESYRPLIYHGLITFLIEYILLISRRQYYILFFSAVALGMLPPAFSGFGIMALSSGVILVNFFLFFILIKNFNKITYGIVIYCLIMAIYFLIQHIFIGSWIDKSYASLLPFILILFAPYFSSFEIDRFNPGVVKRVIFNIFYFLSIVGLANYLSNYGVGKYFGYANGKPVFPFLEPSHFSLFYGLFFIAYLLVCDSSKKRVSAIATVLILSFVLPSVTNLSYAILGIFIFVISLNWKLRLFLLPVFIFGFIFVISLILYDPYFVDRLNFSEDASNATALVYLQGIDDARNSLYLTNGVGLGFQMMGTQPPSIYAFEISRVFGLLDGESNRQDGGFLAAKLISELGYFGIILILIYLILFFQSIFYIAKFYSAAVSNISLNELVAYGIVFAFFIEMFGRGIGYFSPSIFIFLMALFYLLRCNKKLLAFLR